MNLIDHRDSPRYIKLHPQDNVGVVVNEPAWPPAPPSPMA